MSEGLSAAVYRRPIFSDHGTLLRRRVSPRLCLDRRAANPGFSSGNASETLGDPAARPNSFSASAPPYGYVDLVYMTTL